MENEKNNAVEKVENVEKSGASASKNDNAANKSGTNNNNKANAAKHAKSSKNGGSKTVKTDEKTKTVKRGEKDKKRSAAARKAEKERKKKRIAEEKLEKNRKKQALKAEKERIRAEKRVEIARIKAHKKAEKEKAKAAILREKNRKKAEAKEQKQLRLAERAKRRDAIKHETKKDRAKRVAAEKARAAEERREAKQRKAELKRQKFLAKKVSKERRARDRQKNRERNKGFGGWLAAVISLGVSTLVLASVLTFTFLMPTATDNMLESAYRRAFYDAVEQVDNMDLNMSKILATTDGGAMQGYLLNLAVNSELAENDIQSLPLEDENKFNTVKLVNQIGDYAKYLNKKLINGEQPTKAEMENLKKLYKANLTLKKTLAETFGNMENDFSFSSMATGNKNNVVSDGFDELEELSVEYPELIYDGPFSDGADDREIRGLSGEKIDEAQAEKIFIDTFGSYGLKDVKPAGTLEGALRCYNVTATVEDSTLFAQISEQGGKVISFSYSGSCKETVYDGDYATEKALKFLAAQGFNGMKPVWVNLSDNVYTINFAGSVDDVIVYPDLVKVRVCAETATVIGMEATSYYTNHKDRTIEKARLTAEQAVKKVSPEIDVVACRTAIVPLGEKSEKLCYEIMGSYDGSTYFVYIDAANGRQVEMFKVVSSAGGEMLM